MSWGIADVESRYCKKSFDAIRVPRMPKEMESWVPGMYCFIYKTGHIVGINTCLPNAPNVLGNDAGSSWGVYMFNGHGAEGRMWAWDGNLERPTLHPSIHRKGHWHGYLVDGKFKSEN